MWFAKNLSVVKWKGVMALMRHTGEIWSRKTKKISSVFAPASCGNRSREVNSPSLLFGGSSFPTPHFTQTSFPATRSSKNTKIFRDDPLFCPCQCPMASEGSMQAFTCPVSFSFKKFFGEGGVIYGFFVRCWLKGSNDSHVVQYRKAETKINREKISKISWSFADFSGWIIEG